MVKDVTFISDYPFYWVNHLNMTSKHTDMSQEEEFLDFGSKTDYNGENCAHIKDLLGNKDIGVVYKHLGARFERLTRYYNFQCPQLASDRKEKFEDGQKSMLYKTYWNCWLKFLENRDHFFYTVNKSTGILFTHDEDFVRSVLSDPQMKIISDIEGKTKKSPTKRGVDEIKSFAIIMNLSANALFLNRLKQNNVNYINLSEESNPAQTTNVIQPDNMMQENIVHKSFSELFVRAKNVNGLFQVLMGQVLKRENVYDIISSFSFENCSILHSQVTVNNEILIHYDDIMLNPMYETTEDEKKLIDQETTMINKEHYQLKKYNMFKANENKRVFKLTFNGFTFAHNIKEIINIFRHTQRNFKVTCQCEESTIY